MRLLRLRASNFKKLSCVELELDPNGGLVIITGKNSAGKTCTMDIISACLGGKKLCPEKPIKDGEKYAEIEVETDDWTVTRRFLEGGSSTLKVVKPDQSVIPKGQTFLDSVLGKIAFDPLAWSLETDKKKQREILLDVVGLDFTELDGKIAALREQRTAVGRTLKQVEAEAEGAESFPDAPDAEIDDAEIIDNLGTMRVHNFDIREADKTSQEAQTQIDVIRESIKVLEKQRDEAIQYVNEHELYDEDTMTQTLKDAQETNRQVRANVKSKELLSHRDEVDVGYNDLTKDITAAEADKATALNLAEMPVEGLTVTDAGVTFNDIPIAQIAMSEKIKVGLAVSMKLNPKLKVLLIRDGSLLDPDNMKVIEEMVKDQGFQCLLERVTDGKKQVGFTIENGLLKEDFPEDGE